MKMELGVLRNFVATEMTAAKAKSSSRPFRVCVVFLPGLFLLSGCGNKFFDPAQIGRFRPVPAVNVILDSLGVAEEAPVVWEGAEEPLPVDTMTTQGDYALRSGDIVGISIYELLREGAYHADNYVVTETGKISIPVVGAVQAAGLSETQLEEEIKKILSPNVLKNPTVTATLVTSQQRAFSVLGDGVQFPGRYSLPRYAFRLTDALATAGSPRQFNVSYIYVSRVLDEGTGLGPVNPGFGELELKVIEPETTRPDVRRPNTSAPRAQYQWPASNVVIASSEMITDAEPRRFANPPARWDPRTVNQMYANNAGNGSGQAAQQQPAEEPVSVDDILKTLSERTRQQQPDQQAQRQDTLQPAPGPTVTAPQPAAPGQEIPGEPEWVFQDGKWIAVPVKGARPVPQQEQPGHIEWIFQEGKWVPVQIGPAAPTQPQIEPRLQDRLPTVPPKAPTAPEVEPEGAKTRLIKIPADRLLAGDPRYNIVIKPGDSITVPVDIIGEFCIMGNVNRTGYIPLTGRPMTLKQAIAAAGGLGPLAWPKRCEVVRRVGQKKEEIVMVDLDKIASGEEPDFFIKPHDLINVGTHATSRWRAILRNAFRATYGFGFVYDRNFADRDFFTHRPIPDWF
jgi:protein involved in polysaccharide export with SLBB domain